MLPGLKLIKSVSGRNASYINTEKSVREGAPATHPFRLNTARRPYAGVAKEPCCIGDGWWGVFEVIKIK